MPDPRPRPRYRLALIGVFAAFSLALVALGVRLGTAGVIGGADRGPAQAVVEPTGAVVDLAPVPAAPEATPLTGEQRTSQDPSRPGGVAQGEVPGAAPGPSAPATPASPTPAPPTPTLPVPTPQPGTVPQPTTPVPPPPVADPVLAPVVDVLDALLGGPGAAPSPPPTLPGL